MKPYQINYLIKEIQKFSKIYKSFKTESTIMFKYDDANNKMVLSFDSDYPKIMIGYEDGKTIRHFNRMVAMVINALCHYYHVENVNHYDNGKFCTFKIIW